MRVNRNIIGLRGATLGGSVLENLAGNTVSSTFIAETVNAALKSKLTSALTARGETRLAGLVQQIGAVNLAAAKDVTLRALAASLVAQRFPGDAGQRQSLDAAV